MNLFRRSLPDTAWREPAHARAAPLPRVLWIELTSRCPFDCVFCSRKLLRGAGRHMDFALYGSLIAQLREPDIIRLNYSGESAHYPKLVEACTLAADTGAAVELVTALAALPPHRVDALAHSGLSRLTVSLHALDAQLFREIYRFAEVEAMRERIERVVELAPTAPRKLDIDFAFVAMRRNLDQLEPIADYASALGIRRLAVHPVIRRDPIQETFDAELDGDRLRAPFAADLRDAIARVAARHPQLRIETSTPELERAHVLDHLPRYYPAALPDGARIHGCDQDPWETVHILADGAVVSCEERDRRVLGNLTTHSLADIWNGAAYQRFRQDYALARDAHCRRCPYKRAHLPAAHPARFDAAGAGSDGLLDGWFEPGDGQLRWSRTTAHLQLAAHGSGRLRLRGLLPDAAGGGNRLTIEVNGVELASVRNGARGMRRFDIARRIRTNDALQIRFRTEHAFCPRERGVGDDTRRLGFGLIEAAFERDR